MDTKNQISAFIKSTLKAMANSEDYCDPTTKMQFLILMAECKENPEELVSLTNEDLNLLSNCMAAVITSDCIRQNPSYNGRSTGEIACAVGFYAFMKLLESKKAPTYPAFVVLLHDGRKYMSEIFKNVLLDANISPYDSLGLMDSYFNRDKAEAIVKGLELALLIVITNMGFYDQDLLKWKQKLIAENETIKQQIGTDYIKYPRQLFHKLNENFASYDAFDFLSEI